MMNCLANFPKRICLFPRSVFLPTSLRFVFSVFPLRELIFSEFPRLQHFPAILPNRQHFLHFSQSFWEWLLGKQIFPPNQIGTLIAGIFLSNGFFWYFLVLNFAALFILGSSSPPPNQRFCIKNPQVRFFSIVTNLSAQVDRAKDCHLASVDIFK